MTDTELKQKILDLTAEWSRRQHKGQRPGDDEQNKNLLLERHQSLMQHALLQKKKLLLQLMPHSIFGLTLGNERSNGARVSQISWSSKSLLVNSGSSANLIALHSLTSPLVEKERRLLHGDEMITCAAGFPTTVSPIVQAGCIPVFLDNDPKTGNIRTELLEEAFVEGKTKAVMIAHTLGNPFDISTILAFCKRHNLWLVEDNCDALGCSYSMPLEEAKKLGVYKIALD